MQIGRGHNTHTCVTHEPKTAGTAGCVIERVMAFKSPTLVNAVPGWNGYLGRPQLRLRPRLHEDSR